MNSGSGTSKSEKGQKEFTHKKISERDRLRYIGFDVFPGEPTDLFKSEAEKTKMVEEVRARREHHDHLRGDCTLLEERVSGTDRLFLSVGSILIILALFLPWYAVYNEIVEESGPIEEVETPAANTFDSASLGVTTNAADAVPASTPTDTSSGAAVSTSGSTEPTEELITTVMVRKKIHKEFERKSGLGSLISIGSVGSAVFSSGLALMLTAVLFLAFTLLCMVLPIYNLYGIYALKGDPDSRALKLKKMLRLNWIPLLVIVAGLLLSFFGGSYSSDAAGKFTSLGDNYGPLAYLGTLSWGIFVSLAGFILCAAKGAEI